MLFLGGFYNDISFYAYNLLEPVLYLSVCGFSSIILLNTRKKSAGILPYGKEF